MFIKIFCFKNTSYNKNDRGRHIANSGEKSISESTNKVVLEVPRKKKCFESADRDYKVIFAKTGPEVLGLKDKC